MKPNYSEIYTILRQSNWKITPQRKVIIEALYMAQAPVAPLQLFSMSRKNNPRIGLVTVYRTLEILDSAGLICHLNLPDGQRGYMLKHCTAGHHHHLLCTICGLMVNFDNCNLADVENELATRTGFVIQSHLVELNGVCPACQC